jgi:hypothetical protein
MQNIAPLDRCGAKFCPFGYMWCKILPYWIHMLQNFAPLDKRGAKIAPLDRRGAKFCPFG